MRKHLGAKVRIYQCLELKIGNAADKKTQVKDLMSEGNLRMFDGHEIWLKTSR